jgi:hypothetical protein
MVSSPQIQQATNADRADRGQSFRRLLECDVVIADDERARNTKLAGDTKYPEKVAFVPRWSNGKFVVAAFERETTARAAATKRRSPN